MLRPIACLSREPPNRVAEFIDATSPSLNEERLRQFFLPMDVEAIFQIPLSSERQDDSWF
jgi:hypothetical protein